MNIGHQVTRHKWITPKIITIIHYFAGRSTLHMMTNLDLGTKQWANLLSIWLQRLGSSKERLFIKFAITEILMNWGDYCKKQIWVIIRIE